MYTYQDALQLILGSLIFKEIIQRVVFFLFPYFFPILNVDVNDVQQPTISYLHMQYKN